MRMSRLLEGSISKCGWISATIYRAFPGLRAGLSFGAGMSFSGTFPCIDVTFAAEAETQNLEGLEPTSPGRPRRFL